MTQQQTERDEALIAEAKRLVEVDCAALKADCFVPDLYEKHLIRLVRENWTPPAKPDRYELDAYDAGAMPDYGGKTDWWWDYIRAELGRAHDFYQAQIDAPAAPFLTHCRNLLTHHSPEDVRQPIAARSAGPYG